MSREKMTDAGRGSPRRATAGESLVAPGRAPHHVERSSTSRLHRQRCGRLQSRAFVVAPPEKDLPEPHTNVAVLRINRNRPPIRVFGTIPAPGTFVGCP